MSSSSENAVLILHDSTAEAQAIKRAFAERGRPVLRVATHADLIERARFSPVVIVDRFVGGVDQVVVIERLRSLQISTPIVILSPAESPYDVIDCLNAGADQFVYRPLMMDRLIAHVEAAIRCGTSRKDIVCAVGSLSIDLVGRDARRGHRRFALSGREFNLLAYLMLHAGEVLRRSDFLRDLWRFNAPASQNLVDVYIGKLRRKVDQAGEPRMIYSIRGNGFRLGDATIEKTSKNDVILRAYLAAHELQYSRAI